MVQNFMYSIFNVIIQIFNDIINRFLKMMCNVIEFYKRICFNVIIVYKRFCIEVFLFIIGNIIFYLKNISCDVKVWVNNVFIMVSVVMVCGEKFGDIIKCVFKKVEVIIVEFVEKIKVKLCQFIIKI